MEKTELIKQFMERGLHLGGRRSFVHPRMRKFVFTFENDLGLINLEKAAEQWEKTFQELRQLISDKKTILFLGTQPAVGPVLREFCQRFGLPYVANRWLGGTLTNFETLRKRLNHLAELEAKLNSPEATNYTKKELNQLREEAEEIRGKFEGLIHLRFLPEALFVFCGKKHRTALKEARRKKIKVLGVLGLEDNPDEVDQFIPLNDNTRVGAEFILAQIAQFYQEMLGVEKVSATPEQSPAEVQPVTETTQS